MNRRERTCVRFPQDREKPGHAPAKLAQRERVLSFYKTKAKYPRAQIAPVFPYPVGEATGRSFAFSQNAIGILTNLSFVKKRYGRMEVFQVFSLLFLGEGIGEGI